MHCLHVLFILSSVDTDFTVVVAKSCTHFVVVKQLYHSGRRVERRQVSDDVYIVGQKQPASDLFSRSVAIHTFTHDVRRTWKWSLHFRPSDFVSEGMDSNKHARKYRKLFVSHHRCKLHLKPIAPFHQSCLPDGYSCLTTTKWVHDFATTTVKCVSIDDVIQSTCRPLHSEFMRYSAYWSSGKTHRQPYVRPTPRRSGSTSARRRADEQMTSAWRRSDVDYCRYGGRRTDVGLTSVCLLGCCTRITSKCI